MLRQFALQHETVGRWSARVAAGHHAPPLHAKHDGEQLHLSADLAWLLRFSTSGCKPEADARCSIGSARLGLNLLTRITTGMDLLAGGSSSCWCCGSTRCAAQQFWSRCRAYAATAIPVYCFFGLLDRLYQFYRFGSFTNTYVRPYRQRNHRVRPQPARATSLGPLRCIRISRRALQAGEVDLSLRSSIILADLLLASCIGSDSSPRQSAPMSCTCVLLLAYISFYARYFVWSGDFAWGDRYVSTCVELVAFLAIPLAAANIVRGGRNLCGVTGVALLCGQHGDSACIPHVLASARNLSGWRPSAIPPR